ncbi:MAG: hydrogenase expression/formation C-terminal domain-containing protein [Acidobacteriota bacterium]
MELMNALALLNEIKHALIELRVNGATRTINILNFPLTNNDSQFLDETLGRGNLTIDYRGAEHTFWQEAKIAGVWWGEYRNSNNKVTLRTIEIAEVPMLTKAQREDMEFGIAKLEALTAEYDSDGKKILPA